MYRLINFVERFMHYFIIIALSLMFLAISYQANDIQKQLSQQSNYLFDFFYTANNFVAFSIPIFAFVFFFITTKIMLMIFDINMENGLLSKIIGNSFIGLFFSISFYAMNIYLYFDNIFVKTIKDVERIKFLFGLTFKSFEQINIFGWLCIYILMTYQIFKYTKINILKSIIIIATPSLTVYLIKHVFLNFLL